MGILPGRGMRGVWMAGFVLSLGCALAPSPAANASEEAYEEMLVDDAVLRNTFSAISREQFHQEMLAAAPVALPEDPVTPEQVEPRPVAEPAEARFSPLVDDARPKFSPPIVLTIQPRAAVPRKVTPPRAKRKTSKSARNLNRVKPWTPKRAAAKSLYRVPPG